MVITLTAYGLQQRAGYTGEFFSLFNNTTTGFGPQKSPDLMSTVQIVANTSHTGYSSVNVEFPIHYRFMCLIKHYSMDMRVLYQAPRSVILRESE
jgi:hypothetical protein